MGVFFPRAPGFFFGFSGALGGFPGAFLEKGLRMRGPRVDPAPPEAVEPQIGNRSAKKARDGPEKAHPTAKRFGQSLLAK